MVVRGRTRNAIGPQGRVGSTPTISVIFKHPLFEQQRILNFRILFIFLDYLYQKL